MSDDLTPSLPLSLPLRPADLRGLSRLVVDGVLGVTDVVEAMHGRIAAGPIPGTLPALFGGGRDGRTAGLTGLVYRAVRGTTRGVGRGLDAVLRAIPDAPAHAGPHATRRERSPAREAFVAALNGVFGDHLAATGNPLAIPMVIRGAGGDGEGDGEASGLQHTASPDLVVMIHGLAMNDLQWRRHGQDHGETLARALGASVAYVHYNTGRAIAENGRELSAQLDALVAGWPVPVRSIALVGHSMGGLVARSACLAGESSGAAWRALLTHLACLGTPHHGAPLERAGQLVDGLLGVSGYAAPIARVTRARSAGITDLRHGMATPLPRGVRCHLVAATTSDRVGGLHGATIGDGLVPVASALGDSADPALALGVPRRDRLVLAGTGHFDLLDRAQVAEALADWLGEGRPAQR